MGRGGWWCYTHVVIGGHFQQGTVRSYKKLHSAYMQVPSGPLGGDHGALKIRKGILGVGLAQQCNNCLRRLVGMGHNVHNA